MILGLASGSAYAGNRDATLQILKRVFGYAATVDTTGGLRKESCAYTKYVLRTNRRNAILLSVPSMFAIANAGKREYFGETYNRISIGANGKISAKRILDFSTAPRGAMSMPMVLPYLTPHIYDEMLVSERILSPFSKRNRRYYRYSVEPLTEGSALLSFGPRRENTQLVRGWAQVDVLTGRVMEVSLDGEYDLVRFHLATTMGDGDKLSLIPKECTLNARFLFLGNDITTEYTTVFGLPTLHSDSLVDKRDTTALAAVRPIPLTDHERRLYEQHRADTAAASKEHDSWLSRRLLDNIGRTLLERIGGNIDRNNRGSLHIGPILNPLQFSYSSQRGLTYVFDVQGSYNFNSSKSLQMRIRTAYSFKQRQLYFNIPLTFNFDNWHKGYVRAEFASGKRIYNSSVLNAIKDEQGDSIRWDSLHLTYFRDHSVRAYVHYDPSPKWGFKAGLIYHRRTAVRNSGFNEVGMPTAYTSVAPMIELTYRPLGYAGPIVTANYERSISGFMGANIDYERLEFDAQYIHRLSALSSLQMRFGTGFYTKRSRRRYFLDYTQFRESNIPNGWNDDWSGSFELLNSNWYNASKYYVRGNITYESPHLALTWIPYVGRLFEKERIYVNMLSISRLTPYIEWGYGIQTRALSLGVFASQKKWHFDDVAIRFSIELFNRW